MDEKQYYENISKALYGAGYRLEYHDIINNKFIEFDVSLPTQCECVVFNMSSAFINEGFSFDHIYISLTLLEADTGDILNRRYFVKYIKTGGMFEDFLGDEYGDPYLLEQKLLKDIINNVVVTL